MDFLLVLIISLFIICLLCSNLVLLQWVISSQPLIAYHVPVPLTLVLTMVHAWTHLTFKSPVTTCAHVPDTILAPAASISMSVQQIHA